MKKIIIVLVCLFVSVISFSQTIQKPIKLPTGKPNLPTPNIPLLKPDLVVTAINYVSGEKDVAAAEYKLTLNLTIKNIGAANAGACKLYADYQRESTHGTYWASSFSGVDILAIAGGATVSGSYTFRIKLSALGLGTYTLPVKVFIDKDNAVSESNELNNLSSQIDITVTL